MGQSVGKYEGLNGFCLLGIDGGAKMLEHMGILWTHEIWDSWLLVGALFIQHG
jgi:hypothetical protein